MNGGSFIGCFEASDVATFDDGYQTQDREAQDTEDRFIEIWNAADGY